jgi:hypothetical protein
MLIYGVVAGLFVLLIIFKRRAISGNRSPDGR